MPMVLVKSYLVMAKTEQTLIKCTQEKCLLCDFISLIPLPLISLSFFLYILVVFICVALFHIF